MCGIAGVIVPVGSRVGLSQAELLRMRDAMEERGPDDAGLYRERNVAFVHRRLAIRDLSNGHQPWVAADKNTVLVYNGEIYNDSEIRGELKQHGYRFQTACDTEVVMAAWQHWGEAFLSKLRGMFALGLYDFQRDRLLLARDRFGIKPLFFSLFDTTLIFASTIPALLAYPQFSAVPNLRAVSHYLTTFRLTLGRETLFENVFQLLPGEMLTGTPGHWTLSRYWEYPSLRDENMTEQEAADQLQSTLSEAVRIRLISDVPVGMFLSGGVDSCVIASLLRKHHDSELVSECGGTSSDESEDFRYARICANHHRLEYAEVRVSPEDYLDTWRNLIEQYATPLSTPSDVIIHHLALSLREQVGVVQGGEGADELLCGYGVQHYSGADYARCQRMNSGHGFPGSSPGGLMTTYASQFRERLRAQYGRDQFSSPISMYFALNSLIPRNAKPLLFRPEVWDMMEHDEPIRETYETIFDRWSGQPVSEQMLRVLHFVNLESLLARLDTATMQAGLEARVPYTDHLLVEQMFRVPFRWKIQAVNPQPWETSGDLDAAGKLHTKRILRQVASRLLPAELAERKKASFPTPVQRWLGTHWRDWGSEYLAQSPFAHYLFQSPLLQELSENLPAMGMWSWVLLNISLWGDRFLVR